jgi:hypothetical protein
LEPYKASMRSSLASQGEIKAPVDDINALLGIKLQSFVIPESVINSMESLLLSLAPLQVNYIGSGTKSVKACFQSIQLRDYDTLNSMRAVGCGIIWLGAWSLLGPMGLSPAGLGSSLIGAILLSYKTIETAKPQRRSAVLNKPDVELD